MSITEVRDIAEEAVLALADLAESIRPQFPARAGQYAVQAEELATRLQRCVVPTREQVEDAIRLAGYDLVADFTAEQAAGLTDAVMALFAGSTTPRQAARGRQCTICSDDIPPGRTEEECEYCEQQYEGMDPNA